MEASVTRSIPASAASRFPSVAQVIGPESSNGYYRPKPLHERFGYRATDVWSLHRRGTSRGCRAWPMRTLQSSGAIMQSSAEASDSPVRSLPVVCIQLIVSERDNRHLWLIPIRARHQALKCILPRPAWRSCCPNSRRPSLCPDESAEVMICNGVLHCNARSGSLAELDAWELRRVLQGFDAQLFKIGQWR